MEFHKKEGLQRMARQGFALPEKEVCRIITLLTTTDMTIADIAERMQITRSTVLRINQKFQARDYGGRRSSWKLPAASAAEGEGSKTGEAA